MSDRVCPKCGFREASDRQVKGLNCPGCGGALEAKPGFPWARLFYAALNIPQIRAAIGTVVNGVERDPSLLAWVEQFQRVDQKDCLICIAHGYAVQKKIALKAEPPEHWCPTRRNAGKVVCGCGKPATRKAQYAGIEDRDVCEEFPGCVPGQKMRSRG